MLRFFLPEKLECNGVEKVVRTLGGWGYKSVVSSWTCKCEVPVREVDTLEVEVRVGNY